SIGSNRLSNALRGVFSSSENRADERNTRANLDTNIGNLTDNTNLRLAGVNTERQQQELAIQNIIRNLQSDKESDIMSQAWKMYTADYNKHDAEQNRLIDAYWKQRDAQFQEQQAAFNREIENRRLALQSGAGKTNIADST